MSEQAEIDGLVDEALVRAREENVAAEKARLAIEAPERQIPMDPLAATPVDSAAPAPGVPSSGQPRRPAPPSERAEEAVAAPAKLSLGELVPGPGRAKIELNLPAEPAPAPAPAEVDGPRSPEDIVISEPFQKLPEARSRHAKTDLRMRPPVGGEQVGAAGREPAVGSDAVAAAVHAAKAATAAQGARTVGGRTERLAPVVVGATDRAEAAAAPELSRVEAADVLSRTLGGRTERRLPAIGGAEPTQAARAQALGSGASGETPSPLQSAPHDAGAMPAGEASPWRDGAGGELSQEMLPSSLMPGLPRDDGGAHGAATAHRVQSEPPSSHAAVEAAARRRNRTIVVALLGLLVAGGLVLLALGSGDEAQEGAIDLVTGQGDAARTEPGAADPQASASAGSPDALGAGLDAGAAAAASGAGKAGAAAAQSSARSAGGAPSARSSASSTARANASGGKPSATSRPSTPPGGTGTATGGSSGLFFEKGSN